MLIIRAICFTLYKLWEFSWCNSYIIHTFTASVSICAHYWWCAMLHDFGLSHVACLSNEMWSKDMVYAVFKQRFLEDWRFLLLSCFYSLSRECRSSMGGAPSSWVLEWKGMWSRATAHSKQCMFVDVSHWDLGMFCYCSKATNIVNNARICLWARLFSLRNKILTSRLLSHMFFPLSCSVQTALSM